ncbi:MAG: hypothetical protein IGBAC_1911 [Ignavibacteriae bacterium]|nr:MAG: hypothetical protein IGBAC_1911 [Ignavibacteriota bacterium]
MNSNFQEKLAQLILDEISERLKKREYLKEVLKKFLEFPPEKVAEEFLSEFEKLLTGNLKEEIINRLKLMYLREIQPQVKENIIAEESINIENEAIVSTIPSETTEPGEIVKEELTEVIDEKSDKTEPIDIIEPIKEPVVTSDIPKEREEITKESIESVIEVEELKEKPSVYFKREKKTEIAISENDWLYLYGFSYAPNSEGKGYPSIELPIKGVDDKNVVFGLDYGDVRLYLSKIQFEKFVIAKTGEHILSPKEAISLRYNHSCILNQIRTNEILVPLEFWTIKMGREKIVRTIEERYLNFLHSLIDIHDAIDWDVEVSVLDNEFMKLLSDSAKTSETRDYSRHPKVQRMEVKQFEKVLFKEKEIAQKVNLTLTKVANKIKVDYIITLESSFLDGWKPILSARYVVGKEKRKAFYQSIFDLQSEFNKFKVMISVNSPKVHFKF